MRGQPAVDYLKEHGLYDRLHESIEASQYELDQLPQSRPAGTGAVYRANNPAQHLRASFSGEQMLLEPEMLAAVEPDVHLVGTLLSLRSVLPETLLGVGMLILIFPLLETSVTLQTLLLAGLLVWHGGVYLLALRNALMAGLEAA